MSFARKTVCLLLLVLSASFGIGGCFLLYSDFSVQLRRAEARNAETHRQICTVLQSELLDSQRRGETLTQAEQQTLLQRAAQSAAGAELLNEPQPDGTMQVLYQDGTVTACYSSALQNGQYLTTRYDLTALYRERNAALCRFLFLEAAVLSAATAVTALLARRMTRPLRTLTTASAEIANGEYSRRTALHTGDEVETLSSSFDKMADAVEEKITALQADVQRREDFMGAFAHELKTPMTSIIGYADMLRSVQTDPEEQREAAGAIYCESRRLEALSGKLLTLLGLSGESLTLQPVAVSSLWPRLRTACPAAALELPPTEAVVMADPDLLPDFLCNLITNAVKAGEPGSPIIVSVTESDTTVTLTVIDHGRGIPPELLSRVTEPFYMVDKSRARKQGGSGLGLALCKRIAEAHGSTLQLQSIPGQGTQAGITLQKAEGIV